MRKEPSVAVLGGTFDRFHVGHADLIDAAFRSAAEVGIGVTTASYLRAHPKPLGAKVQSYRARRAGVVAYLSKRFPGRRWWIAPLRDGWGRSVDPGVHVLVVSEETASGGRSVNQERRRRGLPPLQVVTVPLRRGSDLVPVSSRGIRSKRVEPSGRHIGPVVVRLVDLPREWTGAVRDAFSEALAPLPVVVRRTRAVPAPRTPGGSKTWDYSVERGTGGRGTVLRVTDRSGAPTEVSLPNPDTQRVRNLLLRSLLQRRKVFSSDGRSRA